MAELFAVTWLKNNNLSEKFKVVSRALSDEYEPPNSVASYNGVQILREEFSLDLTLHRSSVLTSKDVEQAELIIGVTSTHAIKVQDLFPLFKNKVYSLRSDVPDPWHSSIDVYRSCAHTIKPLVYEILGRLLL
jgi:protein-tyrosine-phosphatase